MRGCLNGFLILLVVVIGLGVAGSFLAKSPSNTYKPSASPASVVVSPPAAATYQEDLTASLAGVKSFKVSDYLDDADAIATGVALINLWAEVAGRKSPAVLPDDEKRLRTQLIAALSDLQAEAFPKLRDAYGPAMRTKLWETDGKARTVGAGFRTVTFIAPGFAANRNIKSSHEAIWLDLMQLRFTRAEYKWVDANVEFSYYTLEPPKDREIATWTPSGFSLVK